MKKTVAFVLILAFILFYNSSCSSFVEDSTSSSLERCDEIVRCLNERDNEGLKSLFCQEVRSSMPESLDQQIDKVFELLEEKTIVSYESGAGGEETSYENGEITCLIRRPHIRPIEFSDGTQARIFFYYIHIYADDPSMEGISEIVITFNSGDENEEKFRIGNVALVPIVP